MRPCIEPGCTNAAHARDRCAAHYGKWRRANPDAPVRTRVSPGAPLTERIASHVATDGDHALWSGFMYRGIPGLVTDGNTPQRRIHNVRQLQLELAGRPKPSTPGHWFAVTKCGEDRCVNPEHLTWTNRRADATLSTETVDDLIVRHARGDLNVADEADALGVSRQTVYKAMKRRGYAPARR